MRPSLFVILFLYSTLIKAQSLNSCDYSVLFYNVENLFDNQHDSLKNDTEFLYTGSKKWSTSRMYQKINGISKVILASNGWNTPSIIGLCEIENAFVLKQLIYHTGLNHLSYGYIHYESPDQRGIDVAFLYKKNDFSILSSRPICYSDPSEHFFTRDALYVKGVMQQTDTLHVFVNHWPSKRGGELASEHKRIKVARYISAAIDSVQSSNPQSKILVMGDFNADYDSPSVQIIVKQNNLSSILQAKHIANKPVAGSYKYQGQWALIDHILVSDHWAKNETLTHQIVTLPFLLTKDSNHSGVKPKRTYAGPNYIGGISDHLPVLISVQRFKK